MAAYNILLTDYAKDDLAEIYQFIHQHVNLVKANHEIEQILKTANSLKGNPKESSVPRELDRLGIKQYRQIFFKPYRMIYQVIDRQVIIFVIHDGRKDMQTLLAQRLLK